MKPPFNILLISDLPAEDGHQALRQAVAPLGQLCQASEAELTETFHQQAYDLTIIDAGTVNNPSNLVAQVLQLSPQTRVVVITSSPHWKIAKAVIKAGARDYFVKSLNKDELLSKLQAALV